MEYKLNRAEWHMIRQALLHMDTGNFTPEGRRMKERLERILASADSIDGEKYGVTIVTSREIGA